MISIQTISDVDYDQFFYSYELEKTFLQSRLYGYLQDSIGKKSIRWGIYDGGNLCGIAQFQIIHARRGRYIHCPHGPLVGETAIEDLWRVFFEYFTAYAQKEKCDFVRISPLQDVSFSKVFARYSFRPAPVHMVNPERTWVLDIQKSEEEILSHMKKTTRYEVRRIEKQDIQVRIGRVADDFRIFWDLHLQTAKRQGFTPFSETFTKNALDIFGDQICICSAYKDGKYFSSSIFIFDDRAGYYHQGASIPHSLPFSYATLWAGIREARRRGCQEFNFWGVVQKDDKKHPWYGLSQFKRGFGGEERVYAHAHDRVITFRYWFQYVLERYERWKKGYGSFFE